MNETFGDPYAVLGLKRGASESEARSAYRRLVKLYHPDKDNSLHAQVRYREIRLAYDLICRHPHPELSHARQAQPGRAAGQTQSFTEEDLREVFHDVFRGYGTAGNTGWQVHEEQEEEGVFHAFGYRWRYASEEPDRKAEIPLSVETIPTIIGDSVSDVFGVEILIRACVTGGLLWMTIAPVSKFLAVLSIVFTLVGSAVFRYVRPGSARRNMAHYFLWSFYYGVGMSAVFSLWSPGGFSSLLKFPLYIFVFYSEILPLWVHPLAWLGEVLSERRKRSKRGW